MATKSWLLDLDDGSHTVELDHGAFSGKRTIRVDGRVVHESTNFLDIGSKHSFEVGGQTFSVQIRSAGFGFRYELLKSGDGPTYYDRMARELRSWALWLLFGGMISVLAAQAIPLDPSWGLVMAATGAGALIFRAPANFVVFGTTLAWVGVGNLAAGELSWVLFALIQLAASFQSFRRFFLYRRASAENDAKPPGARGRSMIALIGARPNRIFPLVASILTILTLIGMVATVTPYFLSEDPSMPTEQSGVLYWLAGVTNGFAALGLGLGLASVLSGYLYRNLSRFAVAVNGSILVALIVFSLLGYAGGQQE
jgi:hypothetical protein